MTYKMLFRSPLIIREYTQLTSDSEQHLQQKHYNDNRKASNNWK